MVGEVSTVRSRRLPEISYGSSADWQRAPVARSPDPDDGHASGGCDRPPMRLEFREPVRCSDAEFGELADVIIDPSTGRVTHLVVEPHHRHDLARLVALDRVQVAEAGGGISLACTLDEVQGFEAVQQVEFLAPGEVPKEDPDSDVGIEDVVVPPVYDGGSLDGLGMGVPAIAYDPHVRLSYDRIPKGSVELRRDSDVHSSDGERVGHVAAVDVDPDDKIVHLVVEHRHLFSKRDVAIPPSAIARLQTDGVILQLSAEQVRELEPLARS